MSAANDNSSADPAPAGTRARCEFALTTLLLFSVVTVVRWVVGSRAPLDATGARTALVLIAVVMAVILFALIRSPWGRISGAHMNPAISLALWLMGALPRAALAPYLLAQLGGSLTGTVLARLVWGGAVSRQPVDFAVVRPAAGWGDAAVFAVETACLVAVTLLVGFFLAHPSASPWLPQTLSAATALIVIVLMPLGGGSNNPARQFGPALLSGDLGHLAVYLTAPLAGAALGAGIHRLLVRHAGARRPRTYRLNPTRQASAKP